jgi:peroxiredoxin
VILSKLQESLCRVKVGDAMPEIKLALLGGNEAELGKLNGERATVVAFWKSDRRMSRTLLADLGPDVLEPFGPLGVAVIGIAVDESATNAKAAMTKAAARFPTLLDPGGKAFAAVGSDKLPRVYLLDPKGKILWFDIEYSLSTRRELKQALRAVVRIDPVSK